MSNNNILISIGNSNGKKPTECNVDLHINCIKYKHSKSSRNINYCLDFGLSLPINFDCNTLLNIYVPYKIAINEKGDDEIYDLGNILAKNIDVTSALFNENIGIMDFKGNNGYYKLISSDNQDPFKYLYILDSNSFKIIEIDKKDPGTLFQITIPNIDKNDKLNVAEGKKQPQTYIRFRIKKMSNEGLKKLTIARDSSSNILKGTFVKTLLLDLRFNDCRQIDSKILEKISNHNKNEMVSFNTVHFFYITDINESIYDASARRNDIRLLEQSVWNNYLKEIPYQYPRLAYHWKQKDKDNKPEKDFNIFFRIDYNNLDYLNLAAYISLIILLSELGSQITFQQIGGETIPILHIIGNLLLAVLIGIFLWRYFHSRQKNKN